MMQCPFLTRIPLGQVRQLAGELLRMADLCPVMGHVIKYTSAANELTGAATVLTGHQGEFTVSCYSVTLAIATSDKSLSCA